MKIISFLSPKGSGKTTAVINIGACLAKTYRVAVIDTDPQQSIVVWNSSGQSPFPVYYLSKSEALRQVRKTLAADFDFVLIDGFGYLHPMMNDCIKISDLVIVPVTPSPIDFNVALQMQSLIKEIGSTVPYRYLINRKVANSRMLSIVEANFRDQDAPLFNSMLSQRQSFINCTLENQSIFNTRDRAARSEVIQLTQEVCDLLGVPAPEVETVANGKNAKP